LESKTRKASDILLELESKLDIALSLIRSQDLNIKVLSNKLNALQEAMDKKSEPTPAPKIVVEAVDSVLPKSLQPLIQDPTKQIPISGEFKLPIETEPQGFRRTSRPETFAGDDSYLPQNSKYPTQLPKMNAQAPKIKEAEVVVPDMQFTEVPSKEPQPIGNTAVNSVPVEQRVVSAHGKSLFLADVEIVNLSTMTSSKVRTNANGKWAASLPIGPHRILIKKYEPSTKSFLESSQEIMVDGTESPLQLQTVIIKS